MCACMWCVCMYVYTHVYVDVNACVCSCAGQKITLWSQFSPSTFMWILGIWTQVSGLCNRCFNLYGYLTNPIFLCLWGDWCSWAYHGTHAKMRTALGIWSPFTMWVPGNKWRSSTSAVSAFTHELSQQLWLISNMRTHWGEECVPLSLLFFYYSVSKEIKYYVWKL